MGFADGMKTSRQRILQQINDRTLLLATELFTKAVDYSPSKAGIPKAMFSQGSLINNWFPYVNSDGNDFDSSTSDDGMASRNRIAAIPKDTFFGKDAYITLSNNVSYAYRAEYLGWPAGESSGKWHWSGRVGPYAMVRQSFDYIKSTYG